MVLGHLILLFRGEDAVAAHAYLQMSLEWWLSYNATRDYEVGVSLASSNNLAVRDTYECSSLVVCKPRGQGRLVFIHARVGIQSLPYCVLPQAIGAPSPRPSAVEGDGGNFGEVLRVGGGFSGRQAGS